MDFNVTTEIPKGERDKHELDHHTGRMKLDRTLFTATTYPPAHPRAAQSLRQRGPRRLS
jgi:inorganic pyrophosphatase